VGHARRKLTRHRRHRFEKRDEKVQDAPLSHLEKEKRREAEKKKVDLTLPDRRGEKKGDRGRPEE